MSIDEFMQTKFFGFLFCCIAFFGTAWFIWKAAYTGGYQKGIEDNPKNRDVHTYIYSDGRMLRFIPGQERPVLIDLEHNTVSFLPVEPKAKSDMPKEASK